MKVVRARTQKTCGRFPESCCAPKGACGSSRHEAGLVSWWLFPLHATESSEPFSKEPGVLWYSGEFGDNVFQMPRLARGSACVRRGILQGCISISGKPWGGYLCSTRLLAPSIPGQKPAQKPAFACLLYWESACCSHISPVGLETILTASTEGLIEACAPAAG